MLQGPYVLTDLLEDMHPMPSYAIKRWLDLWAVHVESRVWYGVMLKANGCTFDCEQFPCMHQPDQDAINCTCDVEAVGMGATSSELRTPCCAMLCLIPGQSHLLDGVTPHISGCNTPLLTGLPS